MMSKFIFLTRLGFYQILIISLPNFPYLVASSMFLIEASYLFLILVNYTRVFHYERFISLVNYGFQSTIFTSLFFILSIFSMYDLYNTEFELKTYIFIQNIGILLTILGIFAEYIVLVCAMII